MKYLSAHDSDPNMDYIQMNDNAITKYGLNKNAEKSAVPGTPSKNQQQKHMLVQDGQQIQGIKNMSELQKSKIHKKKGQMDSSSDENDHYIDKQVNDIMKKNKNYNDGRSNKSE